MTIKDVPLTGIFVNDQGAALDFYTNKLGLEMDATAFGMGARGAVASGRGGGCCGPPGGWVGDIGFGARAGPVPRACGVESTLADAGSWGGSCFEAGGQPRAVVGSAPLAGCQARPLGGAWAPLPGCQVCALAGWAPYFASDGGGDSFG